MSTDKARYRLVVALALIGMVISQITHVEAPAERARHAETRGQQ